MDQPECPSLSSSMGGQRVATPRGLAKVTDEPRYSNEEDNGSTAKGPVIPQPGPQDIGTKNTIAAKEPQNMEISSKESASASPDPLRVASGSPCKSGMQNGSISRLVWGRVSVALAHSGISRATLRLRSVALAVAVAGLAMVLYYMLGQHQDTATPPPWLMPHIAGVNIALAGAAGNGKSTLTNTLRGMTDDASDAAQTGEGTMMPKNYTWRAFNETVDVQLFDLAGAGTEEFPEHSYCEDMGLRWFDAAVIVVARRIREVDIRILQHLKEHQIRAFVVRTQVNLDIASQKRKGISEEQTLKAMRERMVKELNIESPYLISGLLEHESDLDFPKLKKDLMLFVLEAQSSR